MDFTAIKKIYARMASNKIGGFTVPAFNIRLLTFDIGRALFRAAKKTKTGLFIIELAKSEMAYTSQAPKEFALNCAKAAKAENFKGPIFLQADHFKLTETNHNSVVELEKLVKKAISAGFYNIDIDCSSLSLSENIKHTNHFIDFIRESFGDKISIGAEVGEIGGAKTSLKDLREFLNKVKGISKIAAQTGTSHGKGGVVDFSLLRELSDIAKQYNLPGIVQHGASTLPKNIFKQFPGSGACEIHLATKINQIAIDNLPKDLRDKIKTKKDLGPLKNEILGVDKKHIAHIVNIMEKEFIFFFNTLKVANSISLIKDY